MSILPSTSEIINQYNINPLKKLGQNFILDPNFTSKIARAANILPGEIVLEIGPGPGGLTRALLEEKAEKIIAVEYDKKCVEALKLLQAAYPNRLEVLNLDALQMNEVEVIPANCKIVANLPYNIATVLLFKWLDNVQFFSSMTLMFQKEVAMRIQASPSSKLYGRLSVMSQFFCEIDYKFDVPSSLFWPPPKVMSAIIKLTPKKQLPIDVDSKLLSHICKITFGQRRKILSNSLKQLVNDPLALLNDCNIPPHKRPEELSLEEFCLMTKIYKRNYITN